MADSFYSFEELIWRGYAEDNLHPEFSIVWILKRLEGISNEENR